VTSNLQFGLFDQLENDGSTPIGTQYQEHLELARMADQAGFSHWFKSEHHHVPLDIAPSINVFLSAVIQETSKMRISSLVHLLPFYEPMRLYEELCMLDHLSDGRLDIGFGKGISPPEQILWGVPRDEAAARTEEALDYILSAMTLVAKEGLGCLFNYDGTYWSATEHPLEISPVQQPHPPLWRPGTLATAAQMGVSTIIPGPMSSISENVEAYREQQNPDGAGGHTPILSTLRRIVVAPTEAEAVAIAERAWATFDANLTKLFREYDLWPPTMVPSFLGDTEKAFATESLLAGSPAQVAEYFERFEEESGLTHVTLCPAFGNITTDEARTTLDLLGDVVIVA
jgi:alkanesulfonate monooxygenase SsuD/methylene tetrahydromethanopterin reductase-like flavin-dependent oxidoreductase (luciferase family)